MGSVASKIQQQISETTDGGFYNAQCGVAVTVTVIAATLISSKRGQRILRQVGNATRDDDQTVAATDAFTQTDTDEETATLGITATTASATEGTGISNCNIQIFELEGVIQTVLPYLSHHGDGGVPRIPWNKSKGMHYGNCGHHCECCRSLTSEDVDGCEQCDDAWWFSTTNLRMRQGVAEYSDTYPGHWESRRSARLTPGRNAARVEGCSAKR